MQKKKGHEDKEAKTKDISNLKKHSPNKWVIELHTFGIMGSGY